MVREDGSPVLLVVKASPSLSIEHTPHSDGRQESIVDEVNEIPLVRDTLLLVTGQLLGATKLSRITGLGLVPHDPQMGAPFGRSTTSRAVPIQIRANKALTRTPSSKSDEISLI
ncbi:Tubulin-tyrosine ligase [Parelaphostrongylus tenuis]|uniref:Tubulin-tyrosine ligase n=1 Tax=Parelaphostrongylus tenuis TaxID=148309 RepID=A0AAD5WL82_PARTN|nr:Tubulin-tyrosine ligase [Parelaphostrongylus tenuis]